MKRAARRVKTAWLALFGDVRHDPAAWGTPMTGPRHRRHAAEGGTVREPHFGRTRHGMAVHLRTFDHHPDHNAYARFNKWCAIWITRNVGSMTAFWVFTVLAAFVAPSCLYAAGYIHWKTFLTTFGFELLATLILSTWLELALMPAIMVGQNLQSAASDARSAKQFEDTETIRTDVATALDRLNTHTKGGIKDVLDAVNALASGEQQERIRRP